MKPQTLEVMTNLSVKAINEDLKPLADADEGLVGCDGSDLRDLALNCRNIADVAEALENVFLTAADEADRIEAAAADMRISPVTAVSIRRAASEKSVMCTKAVTHGY